MNEKVRDTVPWVVVVAIGLGILANRQHWFGWGASDTSGPAKAVALASGGTTDGDKCGVKGFRHFVLPPASATDGNGDTSPGPQLSLGDTGFTDLGHDPAYFDVELLLGQGKSGSMDLSPPLGPEGVAVEIEGPHGLVGGAYGLPVKLGVGATRGAGGKIHVSPRTGGRVEVTFPVTALCPGYDGYEVAKQLDPPIDSHNTMIAQPPYTLTVSISDPAISGLRQSAGSPIPGDVLRADNRVPLQ